MRPISASLSLMLLAGCSTIQTHSQNSQQLHPYIGTSSAVNKTIRAWRDYDYYGEAALYSADIPASFIADTLILPYDAYRYLVTPRPSQPPLISK